ncbi:Arsenate reductase [compost metagenome]
MLGLLGLEPRDLMRRQETAYREQGLDRDGLSDDRLIEAMVAHPILIERPIVETEKGVRVCRPQDKVREIL